MNLDGKKAQDHPKIKIRQPKLCCRVNPAFYCVKCTGVVCHFCNYVDEDESDNSEYEGGPPLLNYLGHILEECLYRPDDEVAASWIRFDER